MVCLCVDFRSATKLKKKLDETVEKLDVNAPCFVPGDSKTTEKQKRDIQAPTEAELNSFYEKLNTRKGRLTLSLFATFILVLVTQRFAALTVSAHPTMEI